MIIPTCQGFGVKKPLAEDVDDKKQLKIHQKRFYILLSLHASLTKEPIYLGVILWFYALNLPLIILLGAFINTPTEVSMNNFVYIGSSSRMSFLINSING